MTTILEPFLLSVADYSLRCPDEARHHLRVMDAHQRAVQDWLLGDGDEERVEEGLYEVGVEPDDFWNVVETKIAMQERRGLTEIEGLDMVLRPSRDEPLAPSSESLIWTPHGMVV